MLEVAVQAHAKEKLQKADALALAKQVSDIYSAKGKKVQHLNLAKYKPKNEEVLALMMGPTGNLRAPVVRKGKTLIVGFNEEVYSRVLV